MIKEDRNVNEKLTPKDYEQMWGENGPYSQVRLCEEARILDDSVSRVFLVVEAEINPFTFEYIQKHREHFADDEPVLQLLNYAENRGKFGYVVAAGEVELEDEASRRFARKQADMTIQTLIRMHAFVIDKCGLRGDGGYGVIADHTPRDNRFVWNGEADRVEPIEDGLWDSKTFVGSQAEIRNNKIRFFFVLPFNKLFHFNKESATVLAKTLKLISAKFKVEIEDAESFQEYILLTTLLPHDTAPANFIEAILDGCNATEKEPIFQKDYFVTNVKKPTPEQIMSFLAQFPLDKDIKIPLWPKTTDRI